MPSSARKRWQDVDKTQIPLESLIKSFLMHQEDRNHSPKTVKWYSEMLGRFARFLGQETKVKELDIEAVRRYQRQLRNENLSKFSVHAYMRTVKTFLRWLGREGYVDKELWPHVRDHEADRGLPRAGDGRRPVSRRRRRVLAARL